MSSRANRGLAARRTGLAFAVVLLLSGIASVALQKWAFRDPTIAADWARAAEWVVAEMGEDDVFRIEPWWYERALTHFVGVGNQADRIREPLLEDLYRYDEVFVVSQADRLDKALRTLPFDARPTATRDFGTVLVARVSVPRDAFGWELLRELQTASVSRVKGAQIEPCTKWNSHLRRWDCGKQARWLYVGRALREVGDDPRECVWAHPLDKGRTLRIEAVTPKSRAIRVRGSFDLRAARLPRTGEVLMQVFVDDELKYERHVTHDDHAYAAHDIDVSQLPGPAKLRIEVDLKGSIKDRFFCLNAWSIP